MISPFFIFVMLLFSCYVITFNFVAAAEEIAISTEECLRLGFNSLSLQCETCETLVRVIGEDEELQKDCSRCCSTNTEDQYDLAILEVDKRFISAFPNIPDIVKTIPSSKSKKKSKEDSGNSNVNDAAMKIQNRSISIRYRFGARPSLYLYRSKEDEEPDKVTYIGTWNMDDFVDFVTSHVKIVQKK